MARTPLTEDAVQQAMTRLPKWERVGSTIRRTLAFKDFSEAWAFMTRVAMAAERIDHHPDWSNVYSRVVITLWTHDAGGLTHKDLALAERIDELAAGAGS